MSELISIFRRVDENNIDQRGKFLSRIFGIFSEKIVTYWAMHEEAPFSAHLLRPTVREYGEQHGYTLDFTFEERTKESKPRRFVSEMKCEIEYEGFKYYLLTSSTQLKHHKSKPAFNLFLKAAQKPNDLIITVPKIGQIECHGAILIWGAVTEQGKRDVMASTSLHDVLSIEDMCKDLVRWEDSAYIEFLKEMQEWCNQLFSSLAVIK
jgi:hypothetical protein